MPLLTDFEHLARTLTYARDLGAAIEEQVRAAVTVPSDHAISFNELTQVLQTIYGEVKLTSQQGKFMSGENMYVGDLRRKAVNERLSNHVKVLGAPEHRDHLVALLHTIINEMMEN